MTRHDTRRRFETTHGGLVTPALAECLEGGGDGEMSGGDRTIADGLNAAERYDYPAVEGVVQVTVAPR